MIARILIPVVVFTLLPYLWIYKRYGKLRLKRLWQRVLFWLPAFVVIAYSAYITILPNFLPRNPVLIDIWFVMMAVCAVPQFVFSLFSLFGWCCMRLLHGHRNWGKLLGLVVGAVAFICFIYGFTQSAEVFRGLSHRSVQRHPSRVILWLAWSSASARYRQHQCRKT